MNRIVTQEEPQKDKPDPTVAEARRFTETVRRFADYDFSISQEQIIRQLPFMAYLSGLVVLFIFNSHRAESVIRETDRINKEVKDLRSEYISELSELMNESRQSAVAAKLAPYGLHELKTPPSKITYREE